MSRVVCADVGSTFTKVAIVDLGEATLIAKAAHRTTVDTDVLNGLDAAIAAAGGEGLPIRACSSAGGGLRLAVVGYEQLVTAEAGHRVGLSAGARVVHVAAGRLTPDGITALKSVRPDVVLLVGGTDGGDAEVLVHNATRLARARFRVPVVIAGNVDARPQVTELLEAARTPVVATDNVLPRIGVLEPRPAREAIREVFLRHVIGGKGLSKGPRFASLVRGATPDIVLTGVELLAEEFGGDLVVVDIGGATTDVYSVLTPHESTDVAGTLWHSRTVEGDLGMRWSATGVIEAARKERLPGADPLVEAAERRAVDPSFLPDSAEEADVDARIAELAAVVALRRHGRGKDLSGVRFIAGSGGVLRHATAERADRVLAAVLADVAGGWALPRAAARAVDTEYVLAAAGLLAGDEPAVAAGLLHRYLLGSAQVSAI